MAYIITNGKDYLMSHREITSKPHDAFRWNKISKANNVLSKLPQNFKNKNFQVEYVQPNNGDIELSPNDVKLTFNIKDKIQVIKSFSNELEQRKRWLMNEIHTVDLEIVDIEHAAEFYVLNASQGYKIYKMLHDARNRRREFKNELEEIKYTLGTQIKVDRLNNLEKTLNGIHNRKYSARVNKELFGV